MSQACLLSAMEWSSSNTETNRERERCQYCKKKSYDRQACMSHPPVLLLARSSAIRSPTTDVWRPDVQLSRFTAGQKKKKNRFRRRTDPTPTIYWLPTKTEPWCWRALPISIGCAVDREKEPRRRDGSIDIDPVGPPASIRAISFVEFAGEIVCAVHAAGAREMDQLPS